jgi:hypothetical protein
VKHDKRLTKLPSASVQSVKTKPEPGDAHTVTFEPHGTVPPPLVEPPADGELLALIV